MFHTHAGRRLLVALLVSLFLTALLAKRKMVPYASITAEMATLELVPSAGRTAPMTLVSATMELTAISLTLTVEVLVKSTSVDQAVNNGAISGMSSATKASIMSVAAYALPTAQLA